MWSHFGFSILSPRKQRKIALNISEKLDIELSFPPNTTNKIRAFVSRKIKEKNIASFGNQITETSGLDN